MENGDYFGNFDDHECQLREISRHSVRDANAYERYHSDVTKQTRLIRPFLLRTPPDPTSFKPRDIKELMFLAKAFYDLGEEMLHETQRLNQQFLFTLEVEIHNTEAQSCFFRNIGHGR